MTVNTNFYYPQIDQSLLSTKSFSNRKVEDLISIIVESSQAEEEDTYTGTPVWVENLHEEADKASTLLGEFCRYNELAPYDIDRLFQALNCENYRGRMNLIYTIKDIARKHEISTANLGLLKDFLDREEGEYGDVVGEIFKKIAARQQIPEHILQRLLDLTRHQNSSVGEWALFALQNIGSKNSLPEQIKQRIVERLFHVDSEVTIKAAETINKLKIRMPQTAIHKLFDVENAEALKILKAVTPRVVFSELFNEENKVNKFVMNFMLENFTDSSNPITVTQGQRSVVMVKEQIRFTFLITDEQHRKLHNAL